MLTTAQLAIVKADILAQPDLNVFPDNEDGDFAIAALYNLPAVPDFIVWRTDIPTKDVKRAINWSEYIGRSAAPNLDIRHRHNLTPSRWRRDQFRDQRHCRGWHEAPTLPFTTPTERAFARLRARVE